MSRKLTSTTEHVTVDEAARILGMHHISIRRYISQGKLPAYRVGKRYIRIPLDALDDFLVRIPSAGDR